MSSDVGLGLHLSGCSWDDVCPLDNLNDSDGDGYLTCVDDCDNQSEEVNPAAEEIENDGIDNDRDGFVDEAGSNKGCFLRKPDLHTTPPHWLLVFGVLFGVEKIAFSRDK